MRITGFIQREREKEREGRKGRRKEGREGEWKEKKERWQSALCYRNDTK